MASIKKRPNGQWRARYRDEAGREHARHFVRKVDAQRWLDTVTASIQTGSYVDPRAGRITFASYFEQWAARQVWVDGTHKAMAQAVDCATFKDMELRKVQLTHVEAWVKGMSVGTTARPRPLAPGTIKTRFVNVRSVFRAAKRDKLIATDPSEGVRLPRQRKREASMRIPAPDVVKRLLGAADERYAAFIAVAAFAGLRLGEASALTTSDVDFLRRRLHVRRQVQRGHEIRLPKYGSERTVPIPDELVTILSRHAALPHRSEWLFAGAGDGPPPPTTVNSWWRKTCAEAGVSGFVLHDLRHFYASGLIAAGCDVVTVQRALGHATATTTLSTYSHLWPTADDKTRNAASTLAAEVLGPPADSVRTLGRS